MKLNEIIINDNDLLWETLKSNIAMDVFDIYAIINSVSSGGAVHAVDILSRDDITDFIYEIKNLKKDADYIFDENSQTMKIISWLLAYFQE